MYMRIFNTSSRLGQYHSLTQVLTQYQYQFQYQKCSIPIPKISSIEFPGFKQVERYGSREVSDRGIRKSPVHITFTRFRNYLVSERHCLLL